MAELNTSGRGSSKTKRMSTRVDLTAMVDLAFLLITFFMLTTTLAKPRIMGVAMPVGNPGSVKESSTLTLCLGNQNKLFWYMGTNEEPKEFAVSDYQKNGIRELLLEKSEEVWQSTGKNLMVLIKPSEHSKYKNLVDVLDEITITKIQHYAITDISKEDIERLKNKGIYL